MKMAKKLQKIQLYKPLECYLLCPWSDGFHKLAAFALYAVPGLWHVAPNPWDERKGSTLLLFHTFLECT